MSIMGMQYCFTSNNKEPRVKAFCEAVGGKYYVYKANKPSIKGYETAMKLMGTDKKNTFFVGDQLFTDVYGANRTWVRSLLSGPCFLLFTIYFLSFKERFEIKIMILDEILTF